MNKWESCERGRVMYLIAICDDEPAELAKTRQMLENYEKQHPKMFFSVEQFKNAEELLALVRDKNYRPDLLLMDIYMPEKMGIEAAKELREMGSTCRIIFLTSSKEHALEAFRVDAAQYLVKPVPERDLFSVLDKFLTAIGEERNKFILLKVEGRLHRVAVNNIVYCEAQGKTQYLYLADGGQYLLRMTMTEICEMLSGYQEFVRVGIAYMVNLEYIESLDTHEICLQTGKQIYPPRGACKILKEQYMKYYCEEK